MNNLLSSLKKMNKYVIYLLGAFIVLLLLSLFYPRKPTSVKLVPVPGTSYYKAVLEGFSEDDTSPVFCFFGTSWCGYCKALKPKWDELVKSYKGTIKLQYIDCDEKKDNKHKDNKYKDFIKSQDIKGYPTLRYYKNGLSGDNPNFEEYTGQKTTEALGAYLKKLSS